MAKAWLDAADDLGIRVVHPFMFTDRAGRTATTVGVFLPDFGSPDGALLTCRFDDESLGAIADGTDYFQSGLSPYHYEPYDRETFIEALNDWGWFGDKASAPDWFRGGFAIHGGAA